MKTYSITALILCLLLSSEPGWGKANFFTLEDLIENSEVIAIITLETPRIAKPGARIGDPFGSGDRGAGKDWIYSQEAEARVEVLLKGEIADEFMLYGGEDFHYAECRLSEGRFLAFLNKDGELWVGANWQVSLRPIQGDEVEWYIDHAAPFPMKFQDLNEALTQVRTELSRKRIETGDLLPPKSKADKHDPFDLSESPFRRFLHDPTPSELEEWDFIIRYMERRHTLTPILLEVRTNQNETQVRALRFFKGECELDFVYAVGLGSEMPVIPDWAQQLPEKGGSTGLDGDNFEFEVYTGGTTRIIRRWSPERPAREPGLESALGWAGAWLKISGLVPRQNSYGQLLTPN
jgi:hypothetical protein